MLSTSCSLLLVLLLSQAQHITKTNFKAGKVEKGAFVQSPNLQFIGAREMMRLSLLQEVQTIFTHSKQQHNTVHKAYLMVTVVEQNICVKF